MNLQGFFTKEDFDIYSTDGTLKATEPMHLTRQGISNNDFAHTHKYKGLLLTDTVLEEGDLVVSKSDEKFLTTSVRRIIFMNTNQANLWRCDYECSIMRLEDKFIGTNKAGTELVVLKDHIPCVQKDTNAKMQFFDGGLLEGTIKLVYLQAMDIKLADRVVINEVSYQINSIDTSVKGLMCIQLAEDKRK